MKIIECELSSSAGEIVTAMGEPGGGGGVLIDLNPMKATRVVMSWSYYLKLGISFSDGRLFPGPDRFINLHWSRFRGEQKLKKGDVRKEVERYVENMRDLFPEDRDVAGLLEAFDEMVRERNLPW